LLVVVVGRWPSCVLFRLFLSLSLSSEMLLPRLLPRELASSASQQLLVATYHEFQQRIYLTNLCQLEYFL
jgi:hypothetical protein